MFGAFADELEDDAPVPEYPADETDEGSDSRSISGILRGMREIDRPPAERVSVLDRPPNAAEHRPFDRLLLRSLEDRLERVRVALDVDDIEVLVGRDGDDGLFVAIQVARGGGAVGGGSRWVLRDYGAIVLNSGNGRRVFVVGIVADEVAAVRVGDVPAHLGSNAFLAEIGPDDSSVPVITTPEGDREVGRPPRP
jgi:hypothetical protein